jgi:2-oxoglutarate ferredoxin oxidoreductase subunit beta
MISMDDYTGLKPAWCPGCGNFSILKAVNKALVELGLKPHQILMVSGIGQAGKLPHYTRANVFNSLHGRALPVAIGAKIANPELNVIAIGGDGDGYGEGGNHLLHSLRRNHDITYLVHNNQIYGLTKGQASPTSDEGTVTKTTPEGAPQAVNPIGIAILAGAGFVARAFVGDIDYVAKMIQDGIRHHGFALIDLLQPCVTFNHRNTFRWYQERVYKLDEDKGYDTTDKKQALEKAQEWGDRIPIGIIFRNKRSAFEDGLPAIQKTSLVKQKLEPAVIKDLIRDFE